MMTRCASARPPSPSPAPSYAVRRGWGARRASRARARRLRGASRGHEGGGARALRRRSGRCPRESRSRRRRPRASTRPRRSDWSPTMRRVTRSRTGRARHRCRGTSARVTFSRTSRKVAAFERVEIAIRSGPRNPNLTPSKVDQGEKSGHGHGHGHGNGHGKKRREAVGSSRGLGVTDRILPVARPPSRRGRARSLQGFALRGVLDLPPQWGNARAHLVHAHHPSFEASRALALRWGCGRRGGGRARRGCAGRGGHLRRGALAEVSSSARPVVPARGV